MSSRKVEDLSPLFQGMVKELLSQGQAAIQDTGYTFFITDGFRSNEEQTELYSHGRNGDTRLIVTNAKAGQSSHNYGLAVDCAFQKLNTKTKKWELSYLPSLYLKIYPIARALGFELGADWTGFVDKPHFQYPHWENHKKKETPTIPSSDVPQALQRYGKGSLADLVVYIDLLREDSANLTTEKTVSKERLSLIQDIAAKLACSIEPGVIKAELDILLQVENSSQEAQKKLQKTIDEKDGEIKTLNNNLLDLQQKLDQMEQDHQKQIKTMRDQLTQAITQKTQAEEQKKQLNIIQQLLVFFTKLKEKK